MKHRVITSIAKEEHQKLLADATKKGLSVSATVCMIIKERYTDEVKPECPKESNQNENH